MKETKKTPATGVVAEYDWSQATTTGFEHVQRTDLGVPFLMIIQKGSPEYDKTHKDYQAKKIEGITPGDVINTLSREVLYKQDGVPMIFVPCSFETMYVEWKPRNSGGGFVKAHKNPNILNECKRDDKNHDILKSGNLIVSTAYYYGLVLRGQDRLPTMIGMTSTQLKKSRYWLNLMQGIKLRKDDRVYTPPMFSHSYKLSTVPESNAEGSWYGWKVEMHEMLKDPIVIADAIETAKVAAGGQRAVLPPPSEEHADTVPFV